MGPEAADTSSPAAFALPAAARAGPLQVPLHPKSPVTQALGLLLAKMQVKKVE